MSKILVVDDQKAVCYSLRRFLQSEGYEVLTASKSEEAVKFANKEKPDLVLMDVRMPEMDGLEVLSRMKESHPQIQVIMMTAYSTTEKAIHATKLGAYDYIAKPFDNDELLCKIKDAIRTRTMMTEVVSFDSVEEDFTSGERIIGKSQKMLNIYKQIGKIAHTDATVLIIGESGTGKELVARAIYHYSNRVTKPFMAINCAAIPEQLLESELFGYERGAFTGADFRRLGKFEQCSGGTLFLDEIGDMSLGLQSKFLRVLQDGTFERLGGAVTIKTDVRIIAATNKNLEDMVKKKLFREDLYYRLNVVTIHLPPLREKKEDIKELVSYFIRKFNRKLNKHIKGITAEALKKLESHDWQGNVRELENVIQKTMIFCNDDYLSLECCEPLHPQKKIYASLDEAIQDIVDMSFKNGYQDKFQEILRTLEKSMVKRAIELTKGNQVHAAKLLGISRNTLRKKLGEDNP